MSDMTNYNIFVDDEFRWCIYEQKTEHVVASFFFQDDALDYMEFLEDGGAFDGWTPEFIIRKVEMREDINQRFNMMLDD